nr:unnamed protein product [Callosobruchus chinensis]
MGIEISNYYVGRWKTGYKILYFINSPVAIRKCGEAVETAKHVIFDCPALRRTRSSYLEVVQEEGREVSIVQCITQFAKNLGWDSV